MPRGDGTGPAGQGPMSGRGMGNCVLPADEARAASGAGLGRGRGLGRWFGLARGLWPMVRGFGKGRGRNNRGL